MVFKRYFKILFVVAILTVFAFFNISNKKAVAQSDSENVEQSPGGITISPPIREFTAKRGEIYQENIRLSNPSNTLIELYPQAMNFTSSGEGGQPKFYGTESESDKYALSTWISFTQPKIALAPSQVVDFSYTIKIPIDAEPGGHYGVLFFSTQAPSASQSGSQVSISSMIGCLHLLRIEGAITESAALESFKFPKIVFKSPVNFTTRVANLGNIHIKPVGEIQIDDYFGTFHQSIEFNESRGNILPASVRAFDNSWDFNLYKNIGPQKVQLKVVYGADAKVLVHQSIIWVLPWWLFIAVASLILLIYAVIKLIYTSRKKSLKRFMKVPK